MKERVPPGATFFRDTDSLQGNDDLTPEIVGGIRNTAVLVADRVAELCDATLVPEGVPGIPDRQCGTGAHRRIFPVRYDDISPAEFQKFVGEKLGYEFFAKSPDDKYVDALDPESDTFRAKMNILRMEIGAKLEELKAQAIAAPRWSSRGSSRRDLVPPRLVFLAEPAPGLGDHADQLTSFLQGLSLGSRAARRAVLRIRQLREYVRRRTAAILGFRPVAGTQVRPARR